MGLITRSIATRESPPDYLEQVARQQRTGGGLRAYLGTIPDYAEEVTGVLLSGARKNSPADKAGVKTGDIIVGLAGKKIENIYDYTHAIEALKIGQKVKMVVLRDGKPVHLDVVPGLSCVNRAWLAKAHSFDNTLYVDLTFPARLPSSDFERRSSSLTRCARAGLRSQRGLPRAGESLRGRPRIRPYGLAPLISGVSLSCTAITF